MRRILVFIAVIILSLLLYAQERCGDYDAFVEKAILDKNETDILNVYNFFINGRTVENTEIQVSQIINAIKEDEIIIEFLEYPDSTDSLTYWAFVIQKGMKTPLLYEICKETELTSLIDEDKDFYNNANVLELILHSIKIELKEKKTIYYIPSGKLHEIALEYCMDVHGLMRGFKIAGVNTLVMTLDDVVDYVSGQLWIQFFRNLTNGQSKREALLNGIRHIKTMDNAVFAHPKFWTSFILIDGIE